MVYLMQETEAIPAAYPDVEPRWMGENPFELGIAGGEDKDPGTEQVWQRIESYTRTRYTAREVVWIIEGDAGDMWKPPLSPVTSLTAEYFNGGEWQVASFENGPVGYMLPTGGFYRITAQVGGGDVPAAVGEAFMRLHEYARGIAEQWKNDAAYVGADENVRAWSAKAIQLCGAADVLRPYRRLK